MANELTRVFVPFADVQKSTIKAADGSDIEVRVVKGPMTDESLDLDQQIVDFEWAKKAAERWHTRWGNIREQHTPNAIGKSVELAIGEEAKSIDLTGKVVDPLACVKVDEQILQGWSVGIKNARVVTDAQAPNGRIVAGEIVEVSLVDHPANENCKVALVKSATKGKLENADQAVVETAAEAGAPAEIDKLAVPASPKGATVRVDPDGTVTTWQDTPEPTAAAETGEAKAAEPTTAEPAAAEKAPAAEVTKAADDLAEHAASLQAARQAIRGVLIEEAQEAEPGDAYQLQYLVNALCQLDYFASSEAYEYSEVYLAVAADVTKALEAGDRQRALDLVKTAQTATGLVLKSAGVEITKAATVPSKEATVEPETTKADGNHSHLHDHEAGTEYAYSHDHGHAHDGDSMHAEGEDGDHRHDHSGAKAAETDAQPAAAETDKNATADTGKAALEPDAIKAAVSEAVTKALDARLKPLEETVTKMAKGPVPGGPSLAPQLLKAPQEVQTAVLADRVKQAKALVDHPDPQVRLYAHQTIEALTGEPAQN